jgi:hypothetical protein
MYNLLINFIYTKIYFGYSSDDPFDPFADTNQVSPSNNTSNDTSTAG